MFIDELRRAAERALRVELPGVLKAASAAFCAGSITEAEYEALDALIAAKRELPPVPKPAPRRAGSRPRTPESMERRRSWAAAGRMPPAIAARFTLGEAAVLAVMASEISKRGACRLALDQLAALAGVCRATAKRALRAAHEFGLIRIEERRLTGWRNDTNVLTIVSPEWLSWLRVGPKGGGVQTVPPTHTNLKNSLALKRENTLERPLEAAGGKPSNRRSRW
jgi:hypothetical protein